MASLAPPLPPRPAQHTGYPGYSGYTRPGYGQYGPMSSFGQYGQFGSPYSYGGLNSYLPQSRFLQFAEENSLPGFKQLESIVRTFSSVSYMLDSTFHAVNSSFYAVMGVAEHFSKVKLQLSQILSAISSIKIIKYLYSKFLSLIGYKNQGRDGLNDSLWQSFSDNDGGVISNNGSSAKMSSFLYSALVLAAPYLIWKLIKPMVDQVHDDSDQDWVQGVGDHYLATVLYTFTPGADTELGVTEGQSLRLAPKHKQPR